MESGVGTEYALPSSACFTGASCFGALYPVYVRGLAYSRMGRRREASAEFQKIVDHPGITLNDCVGPLARPQLARPLSQSDDRTSATKVYEDLLTIWRDADRDVPIMREALPERDALR